MQNLNSPSRSPLADPFSSYVSSNELTPLPAASSFTYLVSPGGFLQLQTPPHGSMTGNMKENWTPNLGSTGRGSVVKGRSLDSALAEEGNNSNNGEDHQQISSSSSSNVVISKRLDLDENGNASSGAASSGAAAAAATIKNEHSNSNKTGEGMAAAASSSSSLAGNDTTKRTRESMDAQQQQQQLPPPLQQDPKMDTKRRRSSSGASASSSSSSAAAASSSSNQMLAPPPQQAIPLRLSLSSSSLSGSPVQVRVGSKVLSMSPMFTAFDTKLSDEIPRNNRASLGSVGSTPRQAMFDSPSDKPKAKQCKCKRSKCIQQYCDCFREGEYCSPSCGCNDCYNNAQHTDERIAAMDKIKMANPAAFKTKLQEKDDSPTIVQGRPSAGGTSNGDSGDLVHIRGCTCKKSKCQKKYCECYQLGVPCSDKCRCRDCLNVIGDYSPHGHPHDSNHLFMHMNGHNQTPQRVNPQGNLSFTSPMVGHHHARYPTSLMQSPLMGQPTPFRAFSPLEGNGNGQTPGRFVDLHGNGHNHIVHNQQQQQQVVATGARR